MAGKAEIITHRQWLGSATLPAAMHASHAFSGLGIWETCLKRAMDIAGAALALCLFALPMLFIALAIRLDSPGPTLFRQSAAPASAIAISPC